MVPEETKSRGSGEEEKNVNRIVRQIDVRRADNGPFNVVYFLNGV